MRIAVFIKRTTYHEGYGGLETQNRALCEGLASSGHDVSVFSPQDGLKFETKYEKGVKYHFIPCVYRLTRFNKTNWYWRSLSVFEDFHRDEPFDLVLSQSSAGVSILERKDSLGVSGVSIAHGTIMGELRTRLQSFGGITDLVPLTRDLIFGLRVFFGRQRHFIHSSDHVVAVSRAVKEALVDETYVDGDKISVINNGIDPSPFEEVPSRENATDVIFVGQISRSKGADVLLNLAARFKDSCFHLIGDGDLFDSLKEQSVNMGIQDRFVLHGKIPNQEVLQKLLFPEMAVFAFPTRRFEGFPMVLVEAMFAGLPLVAYNVGGVADAVFDGENGYLVPEGNYKDFEDSLNRVLGSAELRNKMSFESRKYAQNNLTLEEMVSNYQNVLEKAVTK
jgi:glycosyltransferase involved in cell wall biosynthesis